LDKLSRKKEDEMGISEQKFETPLPSWILYLFGVILFSMLFLLLGRSFQMQVIEGETYSSLAERNRAIIQPARVLRGVVYDQTGEQLVYNSVTFDVEIDKSAFSENGEPVLRHLADILKEDSEYLLEKMETIDSSGTLVTDIAHEAAIMIQIRDDELPGVTVERNIEREYEDGDYLAHLIGYTGEVTREEIAQNPDRYTLHDYIGKAGLEKYYEEYLAKERGSFKVKTDASGNVLEREEVEPVTPGYNLKLWIDQELQKSAKEEMEEVLKDVGSTAGSVVAMDPQTGGVLSMVSIPSYDNNVFSRTGDKELLNRFLTDEEGVFLNRAIETEYPTGSAIKPLLAAAALEEGIISPEKQIHSPGYLDIPNPWDPTNPTRMMDFQAHGWTDMKEAIAVSSNVYFYTIGGGHDGQEGLGIKRIKEYLDYFGWGVATGVDLPNEKSGFIPDPEWKMERVGLPWSLGDTYNTSIGQGYLGTTPLQVANSYSALVNGGKLMRPQIVKEVRENDKLAEKVDPEIIREGFLSEENLKVVKEGMRMTVTEGTAQRLSWLPVEAGAKTGTAQIPKEGHYHNWIAVFAPYDDPEIILVVLIEEVEGITASASRVAEGVLQSYFEEETN